MAGNERDILLECLNKWQFSKLEKKEREIIDMLLLADEVNNQDSSEELTIKLMDIQKEMKARRGKK